MDPSSDQYLLKVGNYGFRSYDHDRDERNVCKLCWNNALPGGRPFPLIPEAGAVSFGRIVTGPYAEYAREYFYVADDLNTGNLVGYFTGSEGSEIITSDGKVPWMVWRDKKAEQIAEDEFGVTSLRLFMPVYGYLEGGKLLYTLSLGPRAIQFLLHAKASRATEMPKAPVCPEFHFHVTKKHRLKGIGRHFIEHFLTQLPAHKFKKICAQVTVCEGGHTLDYYTDMTYRGKRIWKVFDKKKTFMYTDTEKQNWGLGAVVENVTLVATRENLLAFVRRKA